MKSVKITLPDDLAKDAERAGLLSAETLEQLLRTAVRDQRLTGLRMAMDRMAALDISAVMGPELVAQEVAAFRAARRRAAANPAG